MATRELTVKVADLPAVQEVIRKLTYERDDLRSLVKQFERRVTCLQCGDRYLGTNACGPSHAVVASIIEGGD